MFSRPFFDWRRTDEENRAFLVLSARWSAEAYDREQRKALETANQFFDPDRHHGDEHVEVFDRAVGGLWPSSYAWMTESLVVRNGVSAFEVYLEKAVLELTRRFRVTVGGRRRALRLETPGHYQSPPWPTLVKAHRALGTVVDTDAVRWARDLRHLLTHQNGELRSQKLVEKFRDEQAESGLESYERSEVGGRVRLGASRVLATLDMLAEVVRAADRAVWELECKQPSYAELGLDAYLEPAPE